MSRWVWPTGAKILHYRALVRRGLARETTGICEGCTSHRPGTKVPVFELLDPPAEESTPYPRSITGVVAS